MSRSERGLKRRRRQIAALLPLVSQVKQTELRRELTRIDMRLSHQATFKPSRPSGRGRFATSASGVDGVGGLKFSVNAPPGEGRLIRLPFYLYEIDPAAILQGSCQILAPGATNILVVTGNGNQVVDETNPVVIVTLPDTLADGTLVIQTAFATKVVGLRFRTPQVEWAHLQVVGVTVEQNLSSFTGGALSLPPNQDRPTPITGAVGVGFFGITGQYTRGSYYTELPCKLLLKDFMVGGGANLFMQPGFIDALIYDSHIPEFAGLRAYPKLKSPTRAYIEAAVQGGALTSVTFSISLVCEVLEDTEFGRPIPGPYVRRDATLRRTTQGGDAFVSD